MKDVQQQFKYTQVYAMFLASVWVAFLLNLHLLPPLVSSFLRVCIVGWQRIFYWCLWGSKTWILKTASLMWTLISNCVLLTWLLLISVSISICLFSLKVSIRYIYVECFVSGPCWFLIWNLGMCQPVICTNATCSNTDRFQLLRTESTFTDWQRVRMQENSNEIPAGSLPRTLDIILRHEIVESARAGDKWVF
jgi:hypothetical protein